MDSKPGIMKSDLSFNHSFLWLSFNWVSFVFFLGIPFKCKEDVIPNNEWVQLCQVGGAVEPEYVSVSKVPSS